jgi:ABC-type transport system substrate-binding protein
MDAMFSGKYDLLYGSFVYQNGMPFKFYTEILSSTMDVFKNGYSNEAINAAFAKGAGTVDKAEREGYWLDGLQEVMDNYAPAVFVFNEEWADATTANISGYKLFNDSVIDIRFLTKK